MCLEVDGVIASLVVLRRSGPKVACVEGLRVAGEFRSKGLAHVMLKAICEAAREMSGVVTLRYATYDLNVKSLAVAQAGGFVLKRRFPYVMITDTTEGDDVNFLSFQGVSVRDYMERVRKKCQERVSVRPSKSVEDIREALARSGQSVLLQDWKPLDATVGAVSMLLTEPDPHGHVILIGDNARGFSIGRVRPDGAGLIALFAYWSTIDHGARADRDDLLSHVLAWLERLLAAGGDSFWFAYPECLADELRSGEIINTKHFNYEVLLEKVLPSDSELDG